MAQTPGFDPTTQDKTCFDCKMFDVANWVASLNREDGPGGMPSHEALSVQPQGALEISSVTGQPPSLDRNNFCTPRLVAKSCQCDEFVYLGFIVAFNTVQVISRRVVGRAEETST